MCAQVEADAWAQVSEKEAELRARAGAGYRGVIAGADAADAMAGKGREALAALRAARGALGALAGGRGEGAGPSPAGEEAGDEGADLLFRLGLEASLVVDTPEVVWSFLDEGRFTSAVGRLLQAEAAWGAMESGRFPAELLRLFPVIRRHWPKVQAMRGQVMQMVLQRLGSGAALSDTDAAGLLASLARLGGMSSPELVQLFLEKRLEGARERFGSVGGGGDLGELVAGLVHTGRLLQATVCQAFQLFAPGAGGAAVLLDLAPSFMDGNSSYLGPNAAAGQGGPGSLGGADLEGDPAALPTEETAQLCGEWLQDLRAAFSDSGAFDGVGSAADLGRVEAEIKEALSLPYDELSVSGLHALVSAEPAAARACAALQDRDLGVWGMCFDGPLIGRGRVLIAEAFDGVVRAVQPLVQAGWASASGAACAAGAPGGGGGSSWPGGRSASTCTRTSRRAVGGRVGFGLGRRRTTPAPRGVCGCWRCGAPWTRAWARPSRTRYTYFCGPRVQQRWRRALEHSSRPLRPSATPPSGRSCSWHGPCSEASRTEPQRGGGGDVRCGAVPRRAGWRSSTRLLPGPPSGPRPPSRVG